jgi:hypothetical protein
MVGLMAGALVAAMAPGVASAKHDATHRCLIEAKQGIAGPYAKPVNLTLESFDDIVLGTDGPETLANPEGPTLICGFGGEDQTFNLKPGDVFVGGDGDDRTNTLNGGIFIGGHGDDLIDGDAFGGRFYGGLGDDLQGNGANAGAFVDGGPGFDSVGAVGPDSRCFRVEYVQAGNCPRP